MVDNSPIGSTMAAGSASPPQLCVDLDQLESTIANLGNTTKAWRDLFEEMNTRLAPVLLASTPEPADPVCIDAQGKRPCPPRSEFSSQLAKAREAIEMETEAQDSIRLMFTQLLERCQV